MKKGELKKKTGFTIIEVSLVLAIAGLIFLMVFIALPQLQRSQRDSRRRDDILSFLETVKKYQTNNRGALPASSDAWQDDFYKKYFGDSFMDPDGSEYELNVKECGTKTQGEDCNNNPTIEYVDHMLYVLIQATCSGEKAVATSNPRNIAVMYKLEGAGIYCANT